METDAQIIPQKSSQIVQNESSQDTEMKNDQENDKDTLGAKSLKD